MERLHLWVDWTCATVVGTLTSMPLLTFTITLQTLYSPARTITTPESSTSATLLIPTRTSLTGRRLPGWDGPMSLSVSTDRLWRIFVACLSSGGTSSTISNTSPETTQGSRDWHCMVTRARLVAIPRHSRALISRAPTSMASSSPVNKTLPRSFRVTLSRLTSLRNTNLVSSTTPLLRRLLLNRNQAGLSSNQRINHTNPASRTRHLRVPVSCLRQALNPTGTNNSLHTSPASSSRIMELRSRLILANPSRPLPPDRLQARGLVKLTRRTSRPRPLRPPRKINTPPTAA